MNLDRYTELLEDGGKKSAKVGKFSEAFRKTALYFKPIEASYSDLDHKAPLEVAEVAPGRYRFDYEKIMRIGYYRYFDEHGVPLWPTANGFVFFVTTMCSYALGMHDLYHRTGNPAFLKRMIAIADKLLLCGNEEQGALVYRNLGEAVSDQGEASAMNQGQVFSVLIRAWQLTKDEKYLDASIRGLPPFYVDKSVGGVTGKIKTGDITWYEEYPTDPFHVLNGMIFAMWGLYDLAIAANHKDARELFDIGAQSVLKALPQFDTGYWSTYWVPDKPEDRYVASVAYHSCHILQLNVLGDQTGNKGFYDWAAKWHRYSRNPVNRARAALAIAQSKIHQITHGIK